MPSGGLSLTIHSGLDIPRMIIEINSGNELGMNYIDRKYDKLSAIKYYEDYFF